MKAALIAAGNGERMRSAGVELPKPLVPVDGIPLIDRVLGAIEAAGVRDLVCIFNEEADAVAAHCNSTNLGLRLRIVRKTTPSSMESLFALAPHLGDGSFVLLTVDAVFGPGLLPALLRAADRRIDADGILATHEFIDDEKPLRVRVNAHGRITALGPAAATSPVITAGLYVLSPRIFREIDAARQARLSALRHFLGHLLDHGYRLYGSPVGKTIDVDRPQDITAAEAFIRSGYAA